MPTITFEMNGKIYTANTTGTDSCFFVDPFNNDCHVLQAWEKYRNKQEEEAFKNQPPQLFKFFLIELFDDKQAYTQLVGAENQEEAKALVLRRETEVSIEIVESYEKYCNWEALTIDEAAAQCYGCF